MWELDDWKWLIRVHELLSCDFELLKKRKRSPRKKKDYYPKLSEKAGLKFSFKNHRTNPVVISSQKRVSKKISFKKPFTAVPETSNVAESSKNHGGRWDFEEKQSTTKKKSKNLNLLSRNPPPPPPAEFPPAFKNHIHETGGCLDGVVLVIQKELFDSDLSKHQNRLSIPYSKVNTLFLTKDEVDYLNSHKATIQATLIEPCLQECEISLRNWKSNSMFALVTTWNEVCRRNQLREGNTVQLWSFRRNSELCFGLLVVD